MKTIGSSPCQATLSGFFDRDFSLQGPGNGDGELFSRHGVSGNPVQCHAVEIFCPYFFFQEGVGFLRQMAPGIRHLGKEGDIGVLTDPGQERSRGAVDRERSGVKDHS